jgi:cytochrome c-type biogenesis protein CcmH
MAPDDDAGITEFVRRASFECGAGPPPRREKVAPTPATSRTILARGGAIRSALATAFLLASFAALAFMAPAVGLAQPAQIGAPPATPREETAAQAPGAPRRIPNDTALERRTKEVSAQLRCPVCQGLSLADSPSELAMEMKAVVRDQLASGKSPAEVKAYFVSKYGEWILLEPEAEGFNLAVYLLPLLAILAGGGLIVLMVRRWTRAAPGGDGGVPTESLDESDDAEDDAVPPLSTPRR